MVKDARTTPAGAALSGSGRTAECDRPAQAAPTTSLDNADVAAVRHRLCSFDPAAPIPTAPADGEAARDGLSEAQCIDLLRELEELKAAAAGAQAAITAHLSITRLESERARGIPAARRGRGLATEIALACKLSPHHGSQHLGMARALADLPHTYAALRRGKLSQWRATIIVRETICLSAPQRRTVDAQLWADPAYVLSQGDRKLAALTKQLAYRLDPHSAVARAARAEDDRHVSIRPAPDTMAYVTALLPVRQAVALYAALKAAADSARAAGDPRSRGQVMADTLTTRVSGSTSDVPAAVQLQLVMTDRSLFTGAQDPAHLTGYGTVPAGWARDLLRRALNDKDGCGTWLQRLLLDRAGRLVAMESRSRHAPPGLARYIATRDAGTCRTPWCDAPIRHIDHVVPYAEDGTTHADGLQGLCEGCNYTKTTPGWSATPASRGDPPGDPLTAGPPIDTRTPTGHTYRSPTPTLPQAG